MIDNTPPEIPKEPTPWKGTVLSIAFHLLLFGTIWAVAIRHDNGTASAKMESGANSPTPAAVSSSQKTLATPEEIKPALTKVAESSATAATVPPQAKNETLPDDAAKLKPETIPPVATKAIPKQSDAAIKRKKLEAKKKKHATELAMAKQRAEEKAELLAQQKKQKQQAEQKNALLAKKRAAELALKAEADAQKRKELDEQRSIEKMRQDEMRRITSGLPGNG